LFDKPQLGDLVNNVLKFELTAEEANVVLASLAKQPFEVVAGLIDKLQRQAQPQLAPKAEGADPAP
jgi:hypothetical protein